MVSFLLNFLNKEKKFPFFFVTPLIYAIGNSGEQILLAANKAKKQKKKLIVLYTSFFSQKLNYEICNKSLFDDLIIDKYNSTILTFSKFFFRLLLEIEFFFTRSFILLNDRSFKIKIKEKKRFLSIGITDIYESENIKECNVKKKKI